MRNGTALQCDDDDDSRNHYVILPDWPQMTKTPADPLVSFSLSTPATFHHGPSLNSPKKH